MFFATAPKPPPTPAAACAAEMPSKELMRNLHILRELDRLHYRMARFIDRSCIRDRVSPSDSLVRELCEYAEEFRELDIDECEEQTGLSPSGLRLKISGLVVDMHPDARECLYLTSIGESSLQQVAEEWAEALWQRTMRTAQAQGDQQHEQDQQPMHF